MSYSNPLAALRVASAVADRDADHHRDPPAGDEGPQRGEEQRVRTVGDDEERRRGARDVLTGDEHRHRPRPRSRPARRNDELRGVGRIRGAEGAGIARDAVRVDGALRRRQRELDDLAFRHVVARLRLRGRGVGRAEDEAAVFVGGRHGAIREVGRVDVAR
ncbi:MAG: hypothetical protein U0599_27160 [Vicinamibacteria bacterium]